MSTDSKRSRGKAAKRRAAGLQAQQLQVAVASPARPSAETTTATRKRRRRFVL